MFADSLVPIELRCEYKNEPVGIDAVLPRLSWIFSSQSRNFIQSAYQILVASDPKFLIKNHGNLWNSGKVCSSQSVNINYRGKNLKSSQRCFWKVCCWDIKNKQSHFSEITWFEMGLLHTNDWQGSWIASSKNVSSPLIRKDITLSERPKTARVYLCGLGYYELRINGKKIGNQVLDPASSYYTNVLPYKLGTRVFYTSHDVSHILNSGSNTIGIILGNGWFSAEADIPPPPSHRKTYADRPQLLLQLNAELATGEKIQLSTESTWKTHSGPIIYNDYCNGEIYDARKEEFGWDMPDYDDTSWEFVSVVEAPEGKLIAQPIEPCCVIETRKPIQVFNPKKDVWVFDMGQNFSGWSRLRVRGARGNSIKLNHGARIFDNGSLDSRSNLYDLFCTHIARQSDTYILKGKEVEEWEPRFTLHGYRYVEVSGFPGNPNLEDLDGRVVHNALDRVGNFICSNQLINQIHEAAVWTFASSLQGFPQDAADRSERVGWLGDPIPEDYMYTFDTACFWSKWSDDLKDSQRPDGQLPVVSPMHWRGTKYDPYDAQFPIWWSNIALIPWSVYQFYDDKQVLTNHIEGIEKLVKFLSSKSTNHILSFGLGDHMEPQADGTTSSGPLHTPPALTSTAYYYFDTMVASKASAILGKKLNAERYGQLAEQIKSAFNHEFLNLDTNQYATGSQTSNALALSMGLVPKDRIQAVLANLIYDIKKNHKGHLSTGMIGTNALVEALPRLGAADVMYRIATQTTFPSWGYMIKRGATTLWESWSDIREEKLSLNMKLLGSIQKFFYRDLLGIRATTPGFKTITINPKVVGDLLWVKGKVRTIVGEVFVNWKRTENNFKIQVHIPGNMTAKIVIPKLFKGQLCLKENRKTLWFAGIQKANLPGLIEIKESLNSITTSVGSGKYNFVLSKVVS